MQFTKKFTFNAVIHIMAVFFLMACNQPGNADAGTHDHHASSDLPQQETTVNLSLNNGEKWKADSSTNKNVTDLYNVVSDANPVVADDFKRTGKAIQANIDKMISECRMKGADHETLHHWLEPLMQMNKKMAFVASIDEGKELFGKLRKHIELYSEYFE